MRLILLLFSFLCVSTPFSFATNSQENRQIDPITQPSGTYWFPTGDLFRHLIADPRQQQFFMSFVRLKARDANIDTTGWLVGFGETIGFVRKIQKENGWQLNLIAGLFAQFDWEAPSKDLINADYTFGVSGSYRYKLFSSRIKLFHQSSHLGDEFLINSNPDRVNLSYEAIDWLGAIEYTSWRFYGGMGSLITRDPESLKRNHFQYGLEWIYPNRIGVTRPLVALDIQGYEQNKWSSNFSLRTGVEIGKPGLGGRRARLLLEYYKGYAPFGQFFNDRLEYYGAGIYLGF